MRGRAIRKTTFRGPARRGVARGRRWKRIRRLRDGGQEGKYHVHRDIFRVVALPPSAHPRIYIFIYPVLLSYLYVDIFRLDETLPRIIKLAKYFRATAVITQAPPLVLLSFSPRRFAHGRERTPPSVSPTDAARA